MSTIVASHTFENKALDPSVLRVADFVGQEALSRLFQFEISLGSLYQDVAFEDLINKPATLTLGIGNEPVQLHGLVADFEQRGFMAERALYRAVLVPRVWILTLTYQSRIFQNLTVEEIIAQVLEEAGFASGTDFRFNLKESYPTREYCAQFRETDWNFICRLMEHEGIFFYFEQGSDGETMVLTDDSTACPMIDLDSSVVYHPGTGGLGAAEYTPTVHALRFREKMGTGKVVLNDYNYRDPHTSLRSEAQSNGDMPGMYYEYGEHFKDSGEGGRLAKVRNQEIECARRVMKGESNIAALSTGHIFTLELGPGFRTDMDSDYLITHLTHFGTQESGLATAMGLEGASYRNEFTCIPASMSYRPPRLTPVPQIPGIMTARIETGGGEYAHIDEEGRYKAKMFFDLSDAGNGGATQPIRMSQPYSGPNYGIHFPNHADTEMVWACVNGNPDRPLALGTVPNPSQKAPSVADNKHQNVIRTWGQNELTFDDTQGAENIYIFATKDHTVEVTNDESISVGHDRTKSIDNDQSEEIGNNKTIQVASNHSETIGMDKTLQVGNNHTEFIGNDMAVITKNLDETVLLNYNEKVGVAMELQVGVSMHTIVGKNASELVGNNKKMNIEKDLSVNVGKDLTEYIRGKHSEQVTEEFSLKTKKVSIIADDEIMLQAGQSKITLKKNGDIKISGKKIEVSAMQDVKIVGVNITSEAKMKSMTKGIMVNAEASGINTIKGSLVKIN